jgi:uncharacterized protein (DUF1501 family)
MIILPRRQFLKQSAAAGAILLSPGLLARTAWAREPRRRHFFVLLRTYGGMDATLGLDPQDASLVSGGYDPLDLFLEYRPEDIVRKNGLRFGPSAVPLAPFADRCVAVNGIFMNPDDAGHDPLDQYANTGSSTSKAATLSGEVALACGLAPLGVLFNSASFFFANKEIAVEQIGALAASLEAKDISDEVRRASRMEATPLSRAEADYVGSAQSLSQLKEHVTRFRQSGVDDELAVVAGAFLAQCSRHAYIDMTGNSPIGGKLGVLDTHAGHENVHMASQMKVWTRVAEIFSFFQKTPYRDGSLFDETTFLVTSEFSRRPFLNGGRGKDHNPLTNSMLLAGKGIRGGRTIGASIARTRKQTGNGIAMHMARAYDFSRKKVAESPTADTFITPANIAATLFAIFGKENPKLFEGARPLEDALA